MYQRKWNRKQLEIVSLCQWIVEIVEVEVNRRKTSKMFPHLIVKLFIIICLQVFTPHHEQQQQPKRFHNFESFGHNIQCLHSYACVIDFRWCECKYYFASVKFTYLCNVHMKKSFTHYPLAFRQMHRERGFHPWKRCEWGWELDFVFPRIHHHVSHTACILWDAEWIGQIGDNTITVNEWMIGVNKKISKKKLKNCARDSVKQT